MQKIGIGYEDYRRIIEDECYYVDKTMLIRDIIEKGGMVTLFTRPRRFGKTVTLSMLRTFFELEYDHEGNPVDKSRLFAGKKIMAAPDRILSMMGRYPVINLSLKSARQPDYYTAFKKVRDDIIEEFKRHSYLWKNDILPVEDKSQLLKLIVPAEDKELDSQERINAEIARYSTCLKTLSTALQAYHNEKVIILLDEYNVPLEKAYYHSFYDEMVAFIRSLFESCLKTNDALQFAVITGCLRISRESIFTGLNHLQINSVRDGSFSEVFGFTEDETRELLRDYGLQDKFPEVKKWYDGYLFGNTEIYNPWSLTKYVDSIVNSGKVFPEPYWANTSSNTIIRDLVWQADGEMKKELDTLIGGGTIEKKIHEDITYDDIQESEDNLWNFLFFTGYMRKVSERSEGRDIFLAMQIPNMEVASIYENHISAWFEKQVRSSDRTVLNKAVLEGDTAVIEEYVSNLLAKSISLFDSNESFYHGYLLSLLYSVPGYTVQSNREEGDGRPDIVLYPDRPKDPAIIFEIKTRKKFSEMEEGLEEAFRQIKTKRYEDGILEDGYLKVKSYGICFCKKSCIVGGYGKVS